MKTKPFITTRKIGTLFLTVAIGLIGMCDSAHAQKETSSGINDATEQGAAIKRDPFWPVGYVPKNIKNVIPQDNRKQNVVVVDNSWSEAMKKVVINGVSSSAENEYFAIINGKVKSVGDTVTINHGGTIYIWAVDGIEPPGSVKLRRVSSN